MHALLMAGGKGTRLTAITGDIIPKPMASIAGKPVIERAVIALRDNGVTDITVSVGHLADVIKNYLGDGKKFGVNIDYITEETPLGSGGALYYLKGRVQKDFVVCSGDTVFDIDIKRMLAFHKKRKAAVTLFTHPNSHPYDSDLVVTNRFGRVIGIDHKGGIRDYFYKNNVNAGFFIVNPAALDYFTEPKKVNMEHDFIASLIERGERVYSYRSSEYIKDAGTPERFIKIEKEIESGLVAERNFRNKQKAIFLDRDGTINIYKGFIKSAEDIELLPAVTDAIRKINESGYLAIIISNQPVIARGECSRAEVEKEFDKIQTLLGQNGVFIDGIYYCPHHPHSGFKGEVKRLKKICHCRKPDIGMIESAAKDFNLDISACAIIGDSDLDVKTGLNAGIPAVKVLTGIPEKTGDSEPIFKAADLLSAVEYILNKKELT